MACFGGVMEADGCFVQVVTTEMNGTELTGWVRDCCSADTYPCSEIHEDINGDGFTGRNDQSW